MACCKCCCGNKDCAEGEQGKCCCGGASGTCCSASEYCCSGVCQSTPCDPTPCDCPGCVGGVTLDLNGTNGTCDATLYQSSKSGTGDNTHGGMEALMFCHGGMTQSEYCAPGSDSPYGIIWTVIATSTFANFGAPSEPTYGLSCVKTYAGCVQAGADCLPVAGQVELTLISTDDGGGCAYVTEPVVTVERS